MARVYISATFEDLNEYRTAAADACLKLGHIAVRMEDFAPTDLPPIENSLAEVANADVYLGIVAWRYGYIPQSPLNPENLSITHLEYREARASGKPCLIFMIGDDASWPRNFFDAESARVSQFRRELQKSHVVAYVTSVEDFHRQLAMALMTLKRQSEAAPELASFDAFVSYNSSDRETVQSIAKKLSSDGLTVWMDEISLQPGDRWQELTKTALYRATTIVVFVGQGAIGSAQRAEIDLVSGEQGRDTGFRVVPVLLPGTQPEAVPLGLQRFRWIAFSSIDDPVAYNILLKSINSRPNSVVPKEVLLNDSDLELITDVLFRVVARLRERSEILSSLDGSTFWAQARKIAPQVSTLEDLRKLKEELSSVPGAGPLWSAWIRNTRAPELAALMRNAAPADAKLP